MLCSNEAVAVMSSSKTKQGASAHNARTLTLKQINGIQFTSFQLERTLHECSYDLKEFSTMLFRLQGFIITFTVYCEFSFVHVDTSDNCLVHIKQLVQSFGLNSACDVTNNYWIRVNATDIFNSSSLLCRCDFAEIMYDPCEAAAGV